VLNEDEFDRYARTGSAGTDWSAPAEDGEIDYSVNWKAM
jgi:hypothetical protein